MWSEALYKTISFRFAIGAMATSMRDNVVRQAFTVDVFSPTHPPLVENSGRNFVQVQAACSVEYAAAYRLRACQAGLRAS